MFIAELEQTQATEKFKSINGNGRSVYKYGTLSHHKTILPVYFVG